MCELEVIIYRRKEVNKSEGDLFRLLMFFSCPCRPRRSDIPAYGQVVRDSDGDDLRDEMDMDTLQDETPEAIAVETPQGGDDLTGGVSQTVQDQADAMEVHGETMLIECTLWINYALKCKGFSLRYRPNLHFRNFSEVVHFIDQSLNR